MGRPREFDVDDALDRAMRVFWAKGYQGASLDDLLAAMGIGRGSLYKAFGDKRSLYLAALQRYDAEIVDHAVRCLCDAAGGDGHGPHRGGSRGQAAMPAKSDGARGDG